MTTIHRTEKAVGASKNSSKKKPKASEIYMDIKNGVEARVILEKHQISLQQLKMIMMHCYKKGMLKKDDLVKHFAKKPSAEKRSDKETGVAGQTSFNSINSILEKLKNEKIIGGLFPLTPQNICALCLILFFFFPWISFSGIVSVSGYKLPAAVKSLGEVAQILNEADTMTYKAYILYILYLIPICGALTIYLNAIRKDSRAVGLAGASIPVVMLIYMFISIGTDTLSGLASGAFLTLLASAAIIIETLYGLDKLKKKLVKAAAARGAKSNKSSEAKSTE